MFYDTTYKCPSCGQETKKGIPSFYQDWYHKSGSHLLIGRYNALVDELKALEKTISEAEREEKMPTARYGNRTVVVKTGKVDSFWNKEAPEVEHIVFTDYLLNQSKREAYMARWGHVDGGWEELRHSVTYYRTPDSILTYTHGGWLPIKNLPALVSNEEWDQLKQGNIPAKLLGK